MDAIGVFDSGVGGLTVLNALKRRWPGENFIYLADTARLPYGSKSLHSIHQYCEQNVRFLEKYRVKAVVVACNSASTAILESPLKTSLPILNVVAPGARKAVEVSKSKRIGVLGTRATVRSEAYAHSIRKLAPEAHVVQQACPLWVPLVEEGWIDDPITNLIVFRYINSLAREQVDTLILGCTHYPALKKSIQKAVGAGIELVDSSMGLIEDLEKLKICNEDSSSVGRVQMLCTDFSQRLEETFKLLLGDICYDSLETIDLNGP
jgi:glutamate racemase